MNNSPENIFLEYEAARRFKASIGRHGLYEQNRINERFFIGDQWHGAAVGNERPLVRHNVVKRIGDYKLAELIASTVSVKYSAEGFNECISTKKEIKKQRQQLSSGVTASLSSNDEIALMVSVLNSYREVAAKRVKLSALLDGVLRDAYIRGTGAIYTYFDPEIKTGLFAGDKQILGDIVCERIKIEDIYFGDEGVNELQNQPYIILKEEKRASQVLSMAQSYKANKQVQEKLKAMGEEKITLLTKLFKAKDQNGHTKVFATKVTKDMVIRSEFSVGISLYPISLFVWEKRDGCIYGESEITYIIPNQIAINRMITASCWSSMSAGMPLMVVNGDLVSGEITNDPGQIIKVYGAAEEIETAINFVKTPDYSSGYNKAVESLILNTLTQCGANEAALGDVEATNTSAIIELREASARNLLPLKNRFYTFLTDIADVWAEFFFSLYGKRGLKIEDENGVWYFPFDANKYKNIVLSVSATVSEGVSKGERDKLSNLNFLLEQGVISAAQYIKRLPAGVLNDREELLSEIKGELI
ncbi:MAG: hypothetical protein J6Q74_00695 [Clostridia bacterium]|nr:hypothetical protein [Clostridia bacterium]